MKDKSLLILCYLASEPSSKFNIFSKDWIISGERLIVWRRGYDVLATGPNVVSADPRVSVEKHNGINILNIRDIEEQDAGEYVCQVRKLEELSGRRNLNPISCFRSQYQMIFYLCSTLWTC